MTTNVLLAAGAAPAFGGYCVGWLILSLINAGLAQGKGRSGLNWWLVSLILGPLATLLVVLRPRLESLAVRMLMDFATEDLAEADDDAPGAGRPHADEAP